MQGVKRIALENATIGGTSTSKSFVLSGGREFDIYVTTDTQVGDITISLERSTNGASDNFYVVNNADGAVAVTKTATNDKESWTFSDAKAGVYYRVVVTGGTSGTITELSFVI